jgi:hypothetical protein
MHFRLLCLGCTLILATGPAFAITGSGAISMEMVYFKGPIALGSSDDNSQSNWSYGGMINGYAFQQSDLNGVVSAAGPDYGFNYYSGQLALNNAPNATFFYAFQAPGGPSDYSNSWNLINFSGSNFQNQAVGQMFRLGTITYQNGQWYGSGSTPAQNVPTEFGFRLISTSPDGPAFNQIAYGKIVNTINSPFDNDRSTLAGQQAEADWITVYRTDSAFNTLAELGSLRVYDSFAMPAGLTNKGSIDLDGMFNSLDMTGLSNPQGGFFTPGSGALPPVTLPPSIPEPASWAMLIAGFGLVGAALRRRRLRAA